jgi:hypothetical protein
MIPDQFCDARSHGTKAVAPMENDIKPTGHGKLNQIAFYYCHQ